MARKWIYSIVFCFITFCLISIPLSSGSKRYTFPTVPRLDDEIRDLWYEINTKQANIDSLSTIYLGINDKADDSDLLDGYDYTRFVDTVTAQNIGGIKTFDNIVIHSSHVVVALGAKFFVDGGDDTYGIGSEGSIDWYIDGIKLMRMGITARVDIYGNSSNDAKLRIYSEDNTDYWEIRYTSSNDLSFLISAAQKMYLTSAGNLYIDGAYNTFSPDIRKDLKNKNPTPDDYFNWALTDAKKPLKPYKGINGTQEERDLYGKDISKMAIGITRWAEDAKQRIDTLETQIILLNSRINILENK